MKLANITCVYCGNKDEPDNPLTDEHVIGRNFVPKGSLATGWNLITKACHSCNDKKADLENDLSAITLLPDLGTSHDRLDLQALAARKAGGSHSRHTGKAVADSYEEGAIEGKLMGALDVRFSFVGPPRMAPERVRQLAHFHLQGFFYLITYNEVERTGGSLPGDLGWVNDARLPDWGNALQVAFADLTNRWDSRIEGVGAEGYFKIAIRRDPSGADLWSFALEWNKALRSIGFFGDLARAQAYVDALPALELKQIDATHRMRLEVPLDAKDDLALSSGRTPVVVVCRRYP